MTNFIIGLVVGMILLLLGQRIASAYRQRDRRDMRILEVVNKYRANAHSHPPKTSGFNGLVQAGVFILTDDSEVREACQRIQAYGDGSPLGKYEDMLRDIDLQALFAVAKERRYDFLREGNPRQIAQELKAKQT